MKSVIAITPAHKLAPEIAIAANRAGELGLLDLGFDDAPEAAKSALIKLIHSVGASADWGIRWDMFGGASRSLDHLKMILNESVPNGSVPVLMLAGVPDYEIAQLLKKAERLAQKVYLEVHDLPSAREAEDAGYDGLIVKGHEAGGQVGKHTSFVLLQELHGQLSIPYWMQGGAGLHSAAAAVLSGAAGVVLCEQLWLTEEGPFHSTEQHKAWSQLDGSETTLVGQDDALFRLFSRSGRGKLREIELASINEPSWREMLFRFMLEQNDSLIPVGQDIAFAAPLAKQFGTVGRIVTAFRESIVANLKLAKGQLALTPESPLAKLHGTRFPITQGPMTRVSDTAAFAKAVADGGALPFLALAVMRGPQVRAMLTETKALLGDRPWGVGILGFMPLELRQEQLDAVRDAKPPFGIIAGGRPSQAKELESMGISTYLHVPSPGLLQGFLKDGARKFVFEGSECGGHTGPRTSFILWESAIEILLNAQIDNPGEVQVLFAGGVHDAMSAAMVSTLAAPLVARGMKVGVLMGTAYLFTEEIVKSGAIVEEFQKQAVACEETALLQSGVGIYTRCADTPFCKEFDSARRELILASQSEDEILTKLEMMNIGRLRIASKGVMHNPDAQSAESSNRYIKVDTETQRREGLYMLGEVARLRSATVSIAELHASIAIGGQAVLRQCEPRVAATPLPRSSHTSPKKNDDIAIVGMACLLPGAENLRAYWQNILRRIDAIREVSDDRWRPMDFFDPKRGTPDKVYSKWGGFLDDIQFDPKTYGIPPASLKSIEPMQLLALEVASQALEDAGFDRRPFSRERTATIFAVGGMNDLGAIYIFRTLLAQFLPKAQDISEETRSHILNTLYTHELPSWTEDSFPGFLGNVVAGRVANRLDLRGPNFSVDAACAASLAALDVGIKQLRSHDADVALVGAVDGSNNPVAFMSFAQTHALSPRGRCRPFDESADGIAISEGVGVLVLKRLADAERDGDRIHALIKGIGSSSDGRNRSLTAPHPQGQVNALKRAYADAGLDPATVGLIEAHGTGTALGDKSEIESLNLAFRESSMATQACAVGSVKSMIGHTKMTAGLAALIKSTLALSHRVLPPTLGVDKPNTRIDFKKSPFYINTETRPWLANSQGHPRRCGVSAFGFGGANFHTILEEYTGGYRGSDALDLNPRDAEIFVFAGAIKTEIEKAVRHLLHGLAHPQQIDMAQLAYSQHRDEHRSRAANCNRPCRLSIVATSVSDLKQKLTWVLDHLSEQSEKRSDEIRYPQGVYYRESNADVGRVCFLFPGQGSQKVNMLRDLIVAQPQLHELFERADNLLADELGQPLSRHIYPLPVFTDGERETQQQTLNATDIAQPALGVTDLAAFELLKRYGLQPDFVAGHSYGEYVALCASGAITSDALIRLSRNRGCIAARAGKLSPGAMAAVDANHTRVAEMIAQHGLKATIANVNAPDQTILAGPMDAIDAAISVLSNESVRVRRIPVSAAFHCAIMNNAHEELAAALADTPFNAPRIPVFSNTTGKRYPENADEMRELLARHIAEPVQFVDEINALYEAGARVFVECGPGLILSGLTDRILSGKPHATLSLDAPGRPGWLQLAHLLAQAQTLGLPVNLETWFAGRGLKHQSLEDLFSRARERANPGPLVWRVNGGRAAPWHAAPRNMRLPTVSDNGIKKAPSPGDQPDMLAMPNRPTANPISALARSNAAARPNVRPQTPAPNPPTFIGNRRITMLKDDPDMSNAALPLASSFSESQFTQVQHNINQFIELQQEQQRTWRHFLDFQAHLIGVEPQRVAAVSRQLAPPMAYADMGATMANNHAMLGAVAPAPVLPKRLMTTVSAEPMRAHIIPTPPAAANDHQAEPPPLPDRGNGKTVGAFSPPAQFKTDLLRAVAERTGYPEDMLALDAHMEADLGIDSIKRIEIFSGLKDQYNLFEGRNEEAVLEQLSGFKTLNEIIAWYEGLSALTEDDNGRASSPKKALTPPSFSLIETVESRTTQTEAGRGMGIVGKVVSSDESIQAIADTHPLPKPSLKGEGLDAELDKSADDIDAPCDAMSSDPVQCYAVRPVAVELETLREPTDIPTRYPILIVGEITPLNTAFINTLKSSGHKIRQLIPGVETRALGDNRFEIDFSSVESVNRLREQFLGAEPVGAIINLMGASAGRDVANKHQNDARSLFLLLKAFEHDLKSSAQEGAGLLLNVTSFDGQFGLGRSRTFPVGAAGTLGVAKSAAREWPQVRVKCIDVAPALEAEWVADQVMTEIRAQDANIETGYTSEGRWRLELKPNGVAENHFGKLALDAGAVLLVTGGAYGITADITRALAEKGHLHLILVGRSAMPEEEPMATRDIDDPARLKQHLIKTLRSQRDKVTPAEIDKTYKRLLKDRRIRANLAAMRATGADVEYHCLDVRDAKAFETLIDDVYARHGRIDGALHGAGVISDKLIGDKSLASFDEVFDTKVTPALVLANKLRPTSLKFLVFFSSVAGRFGNAGQSDYSAANEVLNKLADRLSHAWPTVHTLSINWGPWDAGMVSDELRKLYAAKSIRPIPVEVGKRHCLEELARGSTGEPEIVISSSIKQIAALRAGRQSA